MAVIDVIIIIIVAGGLIIGYGKGALKQIGSIGGIVAAVVACRLAGDRAAEWVASTFGSDGSAVTEQTATVIGYALLFLVVWCAVWLIARIMRKAVHALFLGPIDGLLGALFLAFKWLLVVSLALNLWKVISPDSALFESSKLAGGKVLTLVMEMTPALFGYIHDLTTNATASLL